MDHLKTNPTYTLTAGALDQLTTKIATLNKRARRFGFPLIVISSFPTTIERSKSDRWGPVFETLEGGQVVRAKVFIPAFIVTVTGASPKFNGWTFAAALQHEAGGNIVRNISGDDLPESYRTVDSNCNHCGTRRYRKDTYVLRHESGEYKQVGKQCLKDFTGHASPQALASWLEIIAWVRSFDGSLSEYNHNLKMALTPDLVTGRSAGLAISAVVAYQRHLGELEDRKRAVAEAPAEPYVGKIGERLRNLHLTCTFIRSFDGDYGVQTFCRFKDAEGHLFKWKASGEPSVWGSTQSKPLDIGDEITLTGTVKTQAPDSYNCDRPTNSLSRCKIELVNEDQIAS